MNVPHSLVVDDCANALYVGDRENAAVQRFALEDGRHERTVDLRRWGPVYAITMGPYGTLLALCWQRGGGEPLVSVLHINPYDGALPSEDATAQQHGCTGRPGPAICSILEAHLQPDPTYPQHGLHLMGCSVQVAIITSIGPSHQM